MNISSGNTVKKHLCGRKNCNKLMFVPSMWKGGVLWDISIIFFIIWAHICRYVNIQYSMCLFWWFWRTVTAAASWDILPSNRRDIRGRNASPPLDSTPPPCSRSRPWLIRSLWTYSSKLKPEQTQVQLAWLYLKRTWWMEQTESRSIGDKDVLLSQS